MVTQEQLNQFEKINSLSPTLHKIAQELKSNPRYEGKDIEVRGIKFGENIGYQIVQILEKGNILKKETKGSVYDVLITPYNQILLGGSGDLTEDVSNSRHYQELKNKIKDLEQTLNK